MSKLAKTLTEKRKDRVKKTAEVFTPEWLVKKMLDKLPPDIWEEGKTVLDPACGNGNFLVEALIRKLRLGHNPLAALRTIFGVDIMKDNIRECRQRLLKIISKYEPITEEHIRVVMRNIVLAALPIKDEDENENENENGDENKRHLTRFPLGALNYLDPLWMKKNNKELAFSYSPNEQHVQKWMRDIENGNFFKEDLPVCIEPDELNAVNMGTPDLFPAFWDPDIDIPEETKEDNK